MTESAASDSLGTLSNAQLVAVAVLWKRTGREPVTRFAGTSMHPTIPDGSSVKLHCGDDVAAGDIVAYIYGDRLVLHRLVATSPHLMTRGDADWLPDPAVLQRSSIVGKVVAIDGGAGWCKPAAAPRSVSKTGFVWLSVLIFRILGDRIGLWCIQRLRLVARRLFAR